MAEKKRQYSRALAQKRCLEAIERAILINKSEAERPFVFQVQELVVFGPLVDTDAPTVHGVDILATTARHHRYQNRDEAFHSDSEDFINKYAPFSICSWRFREEFPEKDMLNYLKGRHMGIVTMYGQQDRALLDDGGFFTIIRDGRVQVAPQLYVANLFGQSSFGRDKRQTNYAALGTALFRAMKEHPDATFRVPYGLGCRLAGGNWATVLNLIKEAANAWNVNVEIWALPKKVKD